MLRKKDRRRRSSWTYKIWYGLKICKKRKENEGKEWLLRKRGRPIFPADAAIDPTNDSLTDCIRFTSIITWALVQLRDILTLKCLGLLN